MAQTTSGSEAKAAPSIEPAARSHAIARDGTRIYYEVFAPGGHPSRSKVQNPRPILFVMGLGATGRLWAPAVRRCVAAGFHAITFDNRGCGRSTTPWRPRTTRAMAGDAVAVLDALGVAQAHVAGASLGGMVAQELALRLPERVARLVLASTTGGLRPADIVPRRGALHLLEAIFRSVRRISSTGVSRTGKAARDPG